MAFFTALCVEDNDANMLVMERILSSSAFTVLKASSAETGLKLARQHQPDVILMDIMLPGMDGLTATQLLKADPALKHIPVIAVTASTRYSPEEIQQVGCDGFILKPLTLTKLMSVVMQHCRARR